MPANYTRTSTDQYTFPLGANSLLADEIDRPCARAGSGEDAASDAGGLPDKDASVKSVIWSSSSSVSSVSIEDDVDGEQEPAAAVGPIPRGSGFNVQILDQDAQKILGLQESFVAASEVV